MGCLRPWIIVWSLSNLTCTKTVFCGFLHWPNFDVGLARLIKYVKSTVSALKRAKKILFLFTRRQQQRIIIRRDYRGKSRFCRSEFDCCLLSAKRVPETVPPRTGSDRVCACVCVCRKNRTFFYHCETVRQTDTINYRKQERKIFPFKDSTENPPPGNLFTLKLFGKNPPLFIFFY